MVSLSDKDNSAGHRPASDVSNDGVVLVFPVDGIDEVIPVAAETS
jgi:hypothetical protein